MTAHQIPTTTTARSTGRGAPVPADRSIARRVRDAVLDIVHGIDAGSLVAHGREVPPDHPSRRRRLDHEEVECRLAELYPRT